MPYNDLSELSISFFVKRYNLAKYIVTSSNCAITDIDLQRYNTHYVYHIFRVSQSKEHCGPAKDPRSLAPASPDSGPKATAPSLDEGGN
jgi:hypothetical protein